MKQRIWGFHLRYQSFLYIFIHQNLVLLPSHPGIFLELSAFNSLQAVFIGGDYVGILSYCEKGKNSYRQ